MKRILWIDDEISLLKSLCLLLKEHGYEVSGVSNGEDGCDLIRERKFDLVLLDEIMPGKDGLQTLKLIREIDLSVPVVMITKSEEESMIDKAYTHGVQDFLVKPLKPRQLISTCKRLLERESLIRKAFPEDYTKFYQSVIQKIGLDLDWKEWGAIYLNLARWGIKIAEEPELERLHKELLRECEKEFSKFVSSNYSSWIEEKEGPPLSADVVSRFVIPYTTQSKKVYFIILDCLRFDQWFILRPLLEEFYKIKESLYFSILPSATPFARNAIYSGLYPGEICRQYPDFWNPEENKYEKELFYAQLRHFGIQGGYIKVRNLNEELNLKKSLLNFKNTKLVSIVINFLDYLVHSKHTSAVLEELAPDEHGLRELTKVWFSRSKVYEILKELAQEGNPIILTTDHGAILTKRPTIIYGSKAISRNLRYKYGPALRCDPKHTLFIENPKDYKLPEGLRYGIAREDYYFIYPTHPQQYEREYKYTFQHGGISMQELIIPCITLLPKT
ncbi:response regulator [candidate division WOR-3 bacterium]|nr:response regulator [candidate division WOR-3 bacterium]